MYVNFITQVNCGVSHFWKVVQFLQQHPGLITAISFLNSLKWDLPDKLSKLKDPQQSDIMLRFKENPEPTRNKAIEISHHLPQLGSEFMTPT